MIAVDRKAAKALYRQIYDAYRTAIVDGGLCPGQRIPSTRVLASEIGVSRFPVLNAYEQLLAEGYFESRVGTGDGDLQFPSRPVHIERTSPLQLTAQTVRITERPFWSGCVSRPPL